MAIRFLLLFGWSSVGCRTDRGKSAPPMPNGPGFGLFAGCSVTGLEVGRTGMDGAKRQKRRLEHLRPHMTSLFLTDPNRKGGSSGCSNPRIVEFQRPCCVQVQRS